MRFSEQDLARAREELISRCAPGDLIYNDEQVRRDLLGQHIDVNGTPCVVTTVSYTFGDCYTLNIVIEPLVRRVTLHVEVIA